MTSGEGRGERTLALDQASDDSARRGVSKGSESRHDPTGKVRAKDKDESMG